MPPHWISVADEDDARPALDLHLEGGINVAVVVHRLVLERLRRVPAVWAVPPSAEWMAARHGV